MTHVYRVYPLVEGKNSVCLHPPSSSAPCSPQQYFGTLCTVTLVTGMGCSVYSSSQMPPSVVAICSLTVPPQVCILPEGHSGLCSLFTNPGVRECLPLSTCLLSAGIIPSSFISPSLPYIRCFVLFLTTLSKFTSDRLDAGLETPNMVFQDSKTWYKPWRLRNLICFLWNEWSRPFWSW